MVFILVSGGLFFTFTQTTSSTQIFTLSAVWILCFHFSISFSLNPHHPLKFSLCWQYDGFFYLFFYIIFTKFYINLTEIFTLSPVIFLFFSFFYTIFTKSTSVSLKCSLFRQHIYFLFFCIIFTKSTPVLLKFSLFRQ